MTTRCVLHAPHRPRRVRWRATAHAPLPPPPRLPAPVRSHQLSPPRAASLCSVRQQRHVQQLLLATSNPAPNVRALPPHGRRAAPPAPRSAPCCRPRATAARLRDDDGEGSGAVAAGSGGGGAKPCWLGAVTSKPTTSKYRRFGTNWRTFVTRLSPQASTGRALPITSPPAARNALTHSASARAERATSASCGTRHGCPLVPSCPNCSRDAT